MSYRVLKSNSFYRWVCEAIPAFIFLYLAFLVISQATNIPFWDQWGFADILAKHYEGTLTFADLAESHNGHMMIFPRLIMLCLALLTQWDVRYELSVNLFLGMGIYIGYRQLAFNKLGFDKKTDFLLIPIIAVFVFSLRQYDNWTWGWQIQVFLCSLCGILSLALLSLYPPGIRTTVWAALAAIVATFSFANGIILWPIGLMLLYLRGRKVSCMALWLVLATICIATQILQSKNHMPSSLVSLPAYIKFMCIYLGSSLGVDDNDFSFAYGVFGILSGMAIGGLLFFSPHRKNPAVLFFGAVMLFIILAAALTGLSRAQLRIHDAGTSRYASFSIHFWISLAGLMLFYMKKVQHNEWIKQVCLASLVLVICAAIHTSAVSVKYFYRAEERSKIILFIKERRISPGAINLRNVSWSDAYLFRQAAILKQYHLSFYAQD